MRLFACSLVFFAVACRDGTDPPVDPTAVPAPAQVTSISAPANTFVHDTFIRDGLLFVCAWNAGVIIYDIGNGVSGGSVTAPVEVSRLVTATNGLGGAYVHNAWWFHNPVANEKKYLFIGQEGPAIIPSQTNGDIHVVDVSDLAHPIEVAFYHMGGGTQPQGVHNFWMDEPAQILYAAYYNGGVLALDVSGTLTGDLASREITRVKATGIDFAWGVQLSGTSLYVSDFLNGLQQMRLTAGTFTVLGNKVNVTERYTSDLWISSTHAYTGTWGGVARNGVRGNNLKIWQLTPSGAPSPLDSIIIDSVSTVGDVKGSESGKLLIASTEGGPRGGLWVYSLANPAKPLLVARVAVPGGVHTARIADIAGKRYVFAAKNSQGGAGSAVLIFDVTAFAP